MERRSSFSGFGNFVVRQKRSRKGRNPQTGEVIIIPGHRVVTFKPSNLLRQALNKKEGGCYANIRIRIKA